MREIAQSKQLSRKSSALVLFSATDWRQVMVEMIYLKRVDIPCVQ